MEELALETRYVLSEALHCPRIVSQAAVDNPQVVLRHDREANLPQVRGNRQRAPAGRQGAVIFAYLHKRIDQRGRDPPQPVVIAQGFGEGLGFLQVDVDPLELAQKEERTTQVEAEINGLRLRIWMRWEPVQRVQRLLEVCHRLAVRRVGDGVGPGLAAVCYGLVPHFAPQGVVG
jgi:hypothetical protein